MASVAGVPLRLLEPVSEMYRRDVSGSLRALWMRYAAANRESRAGRRSTFSFRIPRSKRCQLVELGEQTDQSSEVVIGIQLQPLGRKEGRMASAWLSMT